jgi:hypothetical protein
MASIDAQDSNGFGILRLVLLIIELFLGAMAFILGTAFILSMLGANPAAPFASWIYSRTDTIMRPFEGLFPAISITNDTQINLSLLFAMVVYIAIASALEAVARRI